MPITTRIKTSEIETFRLKFDHIDFIKMMNDYDVKINDEYLTNPNGECVAISQVSYTPVPVDQELTIVVNKRSGTEVGIPFKMKVNDKLVIKYRRKNSSECAGRVGGVDLIENCDLISGTPSTISTISTTE
jgi:hypothetical protein